MKKAKIIASVVLAAALGTTVIAAAGCDGNSTGEGAEFKISNYAHALDSKYVEETASYLKLSTTDAHTAGVKKNYTNIQSLYYSLNKNLVKATVKGSDDKTTYTLYDIENDKEILTGKDNITTSGSALIVVTTNVDNGTTYQCYGPDGKLIVDKAFENAYEFDCNEVYSDYNNYTTYYAFTDYDVEEGKEPTVKYFAYVVDEDDEFVSWTATTEAAVNAAKEAKPEYDYAVGDTLKVGAELVDSLEYEDSNYADYTYSVVYGTNVEAYTYYKDGSAVGSITVKDGDLLGYVGNYVYYYENEGVSSDSKNYNIESVYYGTMKINQTLYRYDFVNGAEKAEVVKTDYVFASTDSASLYNYTDKSFDKLYVKGAYKKVDGVAVLTVSQPATLIFDDNFDISFDLAGVDFSTSGVYKLSDTRYLTGKTIYDENLNVVAKLPTSNVRIWEEQSLLRITYNDSTYGNMYIYVDYDGKVVLGPISTDYSSAIYGDSVVVSASYSYMPSPWSFKVYNKANPSGVALSDIIGADESVDDLEIDEGVVIKTDEVYDNEEALVSYTKTVYDLTGKQLLKVENLATNSYTNFTVTEINGKLVVTALVKADDSTNTTQVYIIG